MVLVWVPVSTGVGSFGCIPFLPIAGNRQDAAARAQTKRKCRRLDFTTPASYRYLPKPCGNRRTAAGKTRNDAARRLETAGGNLSANSTSRPPHRVCAIPAGEACRNEDTSSLARTSPVTIAGRASDRNPCNDTRRCKRYVAKSGGAPALTVHRSGTN